METIKTILNKIIALFTKEQANDIGLEEALEIITQANLRNSQRLEKNKNAKNIDDFSSPYQIEMEFDNGYKILKVNDHDRINWIGFKFDNCLKDLAMVDSYLSKGVYYVLVDRDLNPEELILHRFLSPTIALNEIKGANNHPPPKKNYKYINAFLTKKDLKIHVHHKSQTFSDMALAIAMDQVIREERNRNFTETNSHLMTGVNQVTDNEGNGDD